MDFPADATVVQRAAAFRAKYKVNTTPVRVSPWQIGWHPSNRGGNPPSGLRCKALVQQILNRGFDKDEADCGGVLVQERPPASAVAGRGKQYESFHENNFKECEGNDLMVCSVDGQTIAFGTLVHTHLNQACKNMRAGVKLNIPEICDADGRVSMDLVRKKDPTFWQYCMEGLLWTDILSWKIMDEEPEACNVIQAANNAKHGVAMVPHDMECLNLLSTFTAKMNECTFRAAKEYIANTMQEFAEDPNFLHMFTLVVDVGGGSSTFLHDLREFTSKFVDPKAGRTKRASSCNQVIT